MRKVFVLGVLLLLSTFLYLFLFTKISSAHAISEREIKKSTLVLKEVGEVQHLILKGYSQKSGPTGKGCTTATYFVVGNKKTIWFQVRLLRDRYQSEWKMAELVKGYGAPIAVECVYG